MEPGVRVDRFEIEHHAGFGGMGTVFRARDLASGQPVALKVLHTTGQSDLQRFESEVSLLAAIAHPGVVRYVAHGATDGGEPYLVMEWLEGPTLGDYLVGRTVEVESIVRLVRRVAEALAAAHALGIVHRDVKPNNVMLVDGSLDTPKLLDFGIARAEGGHGLTHAGMVLGTPGFMSPEQARGDSKIDARADVFGLGCLLFRCLAGRAPFVGEHLVAILTKTLFDPVPPLRSFRRDVPEALEQALGAMLAKEAADRPAHAGVVAELLASALAPETEIAPASTVGFEAVTLAEQRFLSALFGAALPDQRAALAAVAGVHGGRLEPLVDGSFVVLFPSSGAPAELAVRAARCAFAFLGEAPAARLVVASGRAVLTGGAPTGELVDRAASALASAAPGRVCVDAQASVLVADRFVQVNERGAIYLSRESGGVAQRTLLGRQTECVGRDRELAFLESVVDECIAERAARVVLVTAPPGSGKSRLWIELLRRLRERAVEHEILIGGCDPLRSGVPLGILSDVLTRLSGRGDGVDRETSARRLGQRVRERIGDAALAERTLHTLLFVADLAPRPEGKTASTLPADDTRLFDATRDAWLAWLDGELRARPVVLIVEDLHWGDGGSVQLIDDALRAFERRPLFVLAVARAEVHQTFPRLWSERDPQQLALKGLTRGAAEKLVRGVLGTVTEETIVRLVERAEGNAFHLEELIRHVAEERGDALPDTVLGMVQARLDALGHAPARVLRAASVYGNHFRKEGVAALLGREGTSKSLESWLSQLIEREVIEPIAGDPAESGSVVYAFRHDLMREGAYAMLVDQDRASAHRLAAAWLESSKTGSATELAEHHLRAGDSARAARWLAKSAHDALEAHDFRAARDRAGTALDLGAEGADRARATLVLADALRWMDDLEASALRSAEAMELFERGSVGWLRAVTAAAHSAVRLRDATRLAAVVGAIVEVNVAPELESRHVEALGDVLIICVRFAENGQALTAAVAQRVLSYADRAEQLDANARGRLESTRGVMLSMFGELEQAMLAQRQALAFCEAGDNLRSATFARLSLAKNLGDLGEVDEASELLSRAKQDAERFGVPHLAAIGCFGLGIAEAARGRADRAIEHAERAIALTDPQDPLSHASRLVLALAHLAAGDAGACLKAATNALARTEEHGRNRRYALAVLARAHAANGAGPLALERALAALAEAPSDNDLFRDAELPHLAHAEALLACGQIAEARAVKRAALERLEAAAARIVDPARRQAFLTKILTHRELAALATGD